MSLRGSAFLALWNDVDPAREAEYVEWHALEHVPERVSVAGFLSGRRYVTSSTGSGQKYFTLYELAELGALRGRAYVNVVEKPTDWSIRMRASLRNVTRSVCSTILTTGVGAGGVLGTVTVEAREPAEIRAEAVASPISDLLAPLVGITGLHLGSVDEAAAATHPLGGGAQGLGPTAASRRRSFVVLIEAWDRDRLHAATDTLMRGIDDVLGGSTSQLWQSYQLATWFDRVHLELPWSGRRAACDERRRAWLRD